MKTHKAWSYAPYRPPFFEVGDIYICRVVPDADSITFFWLPTGAATYTVCCARRGETPQPVGKTTKTTFCITGLETSAEYAFFVEADGKKSRTRLARCGTAFGTTVNYLHPEDDAYRFSGRFLCSPSLLRLPDGGLLASMDLFAGDHPQNLTLIFRSDDDGKTWHYQCELFPCFWGKLFLQGERVFMLACSTEYGDLLIGSSDDGGKTFGEPTVLLRGSGGKHAEAGVHKNPQPVVTFGGRLYNTLEWGNWGRGYHAPMVMSAPADADLLEADNWTFSEPVRYDPTWPGVPAGPSTGNIEGCLAVVNGKLYNIMRYDMGKLSRKWGLAVAYEVNTDDPAAPLTYSHCIEFPGNNAKFEIQFDEKTARYYAIVSRITDEEHRGARNILSILTSKDAENWELFADIMNCGDEDPQKIGFQYVDFFIENGKIYYLCRTAMNGADTFHNSNYSIFGTWNIASL